MRTKQFIQLGKQLLPHLPMFVIEKRVLFKSPVDDFLRGMFFESSADADWFYLSVFFLPLFVPNDSVHGTFGNRIGRAANWRADNPNLLADLTAAIQNEAKPFLDDIATPAGVLNHLKRNVDCDRPRVNSHVLEAYAYTLIKRGDYSSGLESLTELGQLLQEDTIPWVIEQRNRAQLIEGKLLRSSEEALTQLELWKVETVGNLGIEKYSNTVGRHLTSRRTE